MTAMKNRALIMDRDGTVFKDSHFLRDPDGIRIYRGAIPALRRLRRKGWKLIIGTNQSGIGRGYFTLSTLKKIHDRFISICRKNHVKIDDIFFCPHHPNAHCSCRKPRPGMLYKAARKFNLDLKRCVIVGDKPSDIEWGRKAGAKTVLVLTGKGMRTRSKLRTAPDYVARSLPHAIRWILDHE